MPLLMSIHIEFCNVVVRFLCHNTAFSYTSAIVQNAKITHSTLIFTAVTQNHAKITSHDQNHSESHGDREYVIILQR